MTLSEGSESTRRGEFHKNGIPYDDRVMFKPVSLMHLEEITNRPSKMKNKDNWNTFPFVR